LRAPVSGEVDFDVAIAGYGPVGATLAGLLGGLGLRVGVFERAHAVYEQPRAVGFDHDAMRIFQRIGVAEALAPHVERFRDARYLGVGGQVIQHSRQMAPPYPFGWAPNYTCDQPGLEAVLRAAVARIATATVLPGEEVVEVAQSDDLASIVARDEHGVRRRRTARYLVGCDGASSTVRRLLGIALESLDYDEPWIVVDMQVEPQWLAGLPQTNVQYCEPERPCSYIVCPGGHRRWEFMVLEGEPRDGVVSHERLWALLRRWLSPGQATIRRAAAYRFHALVARDWRRGRVLLAGDSAHQTPPFLGQGMCQGVRDAGNLAWKLEQVIRGRAAPALLDTYADERRPHVIATTRVAKELGKMISERDPARARERDEAMLARGGGTAPVVIRQSLIPGLSSGLLAAGSPLAGAPFPQPAVTQAGGAAAWLDDLTPGAFRLVLDACCHTDTVQRAATAHAIEVVVVDGPHAGGGPPDDALHVVEHDGLLRRWLDAAAICGALVRPDHYVFGGFATADEAIALISVLAERTAPAPSCPPRSLMPLPVPAQGLHAPATRT
jgi:3-(3-hydroxy-phenyl)propionate hydroxylase